MTVRMIKLARWRMKLTQQDIANELGVTQPRVSSWENGHVPIPRARRWELSKLLNITDDELDQEVEL